MQKNHLIFVILICALNLCYGQNLSVSYKIDAQEYMESLNEKTRTIKDPSRMQGILLTKEALILLNTRFSYTLNISENKSHFFLNKVLDIDSNNLTAEAMAKTMADKGEFYQDFEVDQVLKEKEVFGEKLLIESKISDLSWELTSECKEINGYECYKAVTKLKDLDREGDGYRYIDIFVWFTPEISTSFGPEGYGGLPGLILEKCQGGICLTVDKIVSGKEKISFPKGDKMTTDEYYSFLEEYRQKRRN